MNLRLKAISVFIILCLSTGCGDDSMPTSTGGDNNLPVQNEDPSDNDDTDLNPAFQAEFQNKSSGFSPGTFEYIRIDGPDLIDVQVRFEIDGEETELVIDSGDSQNRLIMLVPPLDPGEYTLQIELDEEVAELEFAIIDYEPIEQPKVFADSYIQGLIHRLEEIISTLDMNEEIDLISDHIEQLQELSDELHTLSEPELKSTAYILNHYLSTSDDPDYSLMAGLRSNLEESCDDYSLAFSLQSAKLYEGIAYIVMAGAANALPGVGTAASIFLAGVGVASLLDAANALMNQYDEALKACLSDPVNDLNREFDQLNSLQAFQSDGQIMFTHNESQQFYVESAYSVQSQFIEALTEFRDAISSLMEYLPERWVNRFTVIPENHKELSPPSRFSVHNISDSDIDVQSQPSGDQLSLTASFKDGRMAEETRSFWFEIRDQEYSSSIINVDAGLVPVELPKVSNMQNEVISGEAVVFKLEAENADYIEIVGHPDNGTLNLINPVTGEVEYTSDQNFIGEDSFTFRAVNENGTSGTATVSLSVIELAITISNLRLVQDSNPEPHLCCAFVILYVDYQASGVTIDEHENPGHFNLSYSFSPNYNWTMINPYATWWRHGTPESGYIQWGLSIHRARELEEGEIEYANSVTIQLSYTYGGVTSNTITRTVSL